jgi:hypothetical protein
MWKFFNRKAQGTSPFNPTPEMIAEARRNPGGWVYQIDGQFGSDVAVPPERIAGPTKLMLAALSRGSFRKTQSTSSAKSEERALQDPKPAMSGQRH